jgi:hypothetical protein
MERFEQQLLEALTIKKTKRKTQGMHKESFKPKNALMKQLGLLLENKVEDKIVELDHLAKVEQIITNALKKEKLSLKTEAEIGSRINDFELLHK